MPIEVSCIAGLEPALRSRRPEQIRKDVFMWQIHALESQVSTGTRSRLQFALVLCFGLRKTVNDFGAQVNGSLDRKQNV